MPAALRIDNLWKSYTAGVAGCSVRVWALRGCSLEVAPGERVAIVGARGAGKTTLLRCIAGERRADAGRIEVTLPIRCLFSAPSEIAEEHARAEAPVLILADTQSFSLVQRRGEGTIILASRDVASVHRFVDRIMLLRDGRLSHLTRIAVRRVAERVIH